MPQDAIALIRMDDLYIDSFDLDDGESDPTNAVVEAEPWRCSQDLKG